MKMHAVLGLVLLLAGACGDADANSDPSEQDESVAATSPAAAGAACPSGAFETSIGELALVAAQFTPSFGDFSAKPGYKLAEITLRFVDQTSLVSLEQMRAIVAELRDVGVALDTPDGNTWPFLTAVRAYSTMPGAFHLAAAVPQSAVALKLLWPENPPLDLSRCFAAR